jgi:hypothetical protein
MPKWKRTWTDIAGALCGGLILMSGTIFWLETQAEREMARLIVHSSPAKVLQDSKLVQEAETALSQLELAELKARVIHLANRQGEREDFTDVQHILLKKLLSPTGQAAQKASMRSIQSLIWQNGRLELEALSESSPDWQSLMNELNGFDRWKTAPQVTQTHRTATQVIKQASPQTSPQTSPNGPSQVTFILKAHLWAHAINASSTPTTKSVQ